VGSNSDSESEEQESTSLLIHGDDTNDNDGAGGHLIMSEKSHSLAGTYTAANFYSACSYVQGVKRYNINNMQ
jgi:hypothetical protein